MSKIRTLPDLETTLRLCRDYAIFNWKTYKANIKRLGLPGNPRERFKGKWPGLRSLRPIYSPDEAKETLERLGIISYQDFVAKGKGIDQGLRGLWNPKRNYGLTWGEITERPAGAPSHKKHK